MAPSQSPVRDKLPELPTGMLGKRNTYGTQAATNALQSVPAATNQLGKADACYCQLDGSQPEATVDSRAQYLAHVTASTSTAFSKVPTRPLMCQTPDKNGCRLSLRFMQ